MWITTWSEMQMQPACACFSLRLGWLEALCWTVLVQCSAVQCVCVCRAMCRTGKAREQKRTCTAHDGWVEW